MFICRNKAHNGAQLLLVMADVYNNYLRLRLSDVILKRDRSSKTASSTIPLTAVNHSGGGVYTVDSLSQEGLEYTVDLSIGTCSCISGITGSVCKHQLAASQYSAVRLPQLYNLNIHDKKLYYKVVFGDKPMPSDTFFEEIVPKDVVCACPLDDEPSASTNQEVSKTCTSVSSSNIEEIREKVNTNERLKQFCEKIFQIIDPHMGPCLLETLDVFERRITACRNSAQIQTFLRTAGSTLFNGSKAFRGKIPCQPTSIARRRAHQPRGKAALLKGRSVKRNRNLSMNISKNVPNGKLH